MDDDARPLKLRAQRTVSMGDGLVSNDSSTLSNPVRKEGSNLPPMIRATVFWLCFGLVSWHYPRYLLLTDHDIIAKPPPYQKTAAGDIILDFTLNEKVADPPIIPCTYDAISKRLATGSSLILSTMSIL